MASEAGGGEKEAAPDPRDQDGPVNCRQEGAFRGFVGEESPVVNWASWVVPAGTCEAAALGPLEAQPVPEAFLWIEGASPAGGAVPMLLDVVEVVEIETQDQQEESEVPPEENLLVLTARASRKRLSPMQELAVLQWELRATTARGSRSYARLRRKLARRRGSYLDRRRAIIDSIPGFWAKALGPRPGAIWPQWPRPWFGLVVVQGASCVQQTTMPTTAVRVQMQGAGPEPPRTPLVALKMVEDVSPAKNRCSMKFSFRHNPYFRNEVITKEYLVGITGYKETHSTGVQWYWDCVDEPTSSFVDARNLTFFNWLATRHCPGSNRIAEIIMEDLWLNPLPYYLGVDDPDREKLQKA
ncbi:testis-specific Y-encoded protein 1-like, partial [Marmota marmota marmota]|uniref:testis-specific Y-encoded protein 1-like n=1 Tax=Marmota marmota marmota TaxID=9994 RepID=UPI002092E98E